MATISMSGKATRIDRHKHRRELTAKHAWLCFFSATERYGRFYPHVVGEEGTDSEGSALVRGDRSTKAWDAFCTWLGDRTRKACELAGCSEQEAYEGKYFAACLLGPRLQPEIDRIEAELANEETAKR